MARVPATRGLIPKAKEVTLHMSVASFLRGAWPDHLQWWHTPNGELRDHKTKVRKSDGKTIRYSPTGQKLKAMGVKAGVPDLTFIMPNGQAAFLELKRADEELSDEQVAFRDAVLAAGCGYAVAETFNQAETVLSRWLAAYGLKLRASTVQRPPQPLFDGARQ